jgi:hypothetical protein
MVEDGSVKVASHRGRRGKAGTTAPWKGVGVASIGSLNLGRGDGSQRWCTSESGDDSLIIISTQFGAPPTKVRVALI